MSLEGVDKDRREVAQGRGSGSEQVAQEGLQSRGGVAGRKDPSVVWGMDMVEAGCRWDSFLMTPISL